MSVLQGLWRIIPKGKWLLLVLLLVFILYPYRCRALSIAREGRAECRIVLADNASLSEKTAALEISGYFEHVTGGRFIIEAEGEGVKSNNSIYIGKTKYGEKKGFEAARMKSEEWIVKSFGENLVILGGYPRGTLYGVYHFLEDVIGIHWWNPWEESVPRRSTLSVKDLNLSGKPSFTYRDIYMLYGNDRGRFAARNRLNHQGDEIIGPEYDGGSHYGPPYHVHTFYRYIPPQQYFGEHPEWFSLINGTRTFDQGQLCLTNRDLRKHFLMKLKGFIESSRTQADASGTTAPTVFGISQNDSGGACQCESCQAIAKREGSEAGPLLDFVNDMAEGIRGRYPGVYIDTLAYGYTENPPRTIRPLDNVIVRLCNTTSNLAKNILDKDNTPFHNLLLRWERIAKNLRVWNYAVTYDRNFGLPLPSLHTYRDDYRFYANHSVSGVFTEHEYAVHADMRDLKVWIMMKLLENPEANYNHLVETFTEGYYGAAGRYVRKYLRLLELASERQASRITTLPSMDDYRYLTSDFILGAHAIFNQAEEVVSKEPVLLRRVRHARLSLDRATALLYPRLIKAWRDKVNDIKDIRLSLDSVAQRYRQTLNEQIELRLPKGRVEAEKQNAMKELGRVLMH